MSITTRTLAACTVLLGLSWTSLAEDGKFGLRPLLSGARQEAEQGPLLGICYGPYRPGQSPEGKAPSKAQMREDIKILAPICDIIRIYGSGHFAADLLEVIKEEKEASLNILLGCWLMPEAAYSPDGKVIERRPGVKEANEKEIATAIGLAKKYPELVSAVCVGNETQVYWSGHRMHPDTLVRYIREVRSKLKLPVTTGDDYNFWNKPESRRVAAEIDFITIHLYALWNGALLDGALEWTNHQYSAARKFHPQVPLVIGEIGWATSKADEGLQKRLMKGKAGEAQQKRFLREILPWLEENKQTAFLFSAFDEPWKGDSNPAGAEKNWGFFKVDRTPKLVGRWLQESRSVDRK